jgi:DNA anti-recombination protein RmuC
MTIDINLLMNAAPYIMGIVAWVFKDRILHVLNIKRVKTEIEGSEINNAEEIIKIYRETLDDLDKRNSVTQKKMEQSHEQALKEVQDRHNQNLEDIKKKTEEKYQDKINKIELEFSETVLELKEQVAELKRFVKTLTEERDFYKKHSNVELPKRE